MKSELLVDRQSAYQRLRGGFPIPLAGAVWWFALAAVGFAGLSLRSWSLVAFVSSGLICPIALLLARVFDNPFMKDRSAVTDVLDPAFIGMLLFWPVAIAAFWNYPALVPLILAIGMSQHWPIVGWSYGKTVLYSAHAIVRALLGFAIWNWLPSGRTTILPLSVALIYVSTVFAICWDTRAKHSAF